MEKEKLVSIVLAAQKGDSQAFTALYEAFQKDIYYYLLKMVDSDSELAADLTQETFLEIFNTLPKLREPAAFVSWSRQIAYHQYTAHFRKPGELLAYEDADGYSVFDTLEEERVEFIPDEALDQEDLKQTILDMVQSLPPEQRSAILLHYYDELPIQEIAEIQGVSEGTVKSRLNYGRKAIGKSVESYEKRNGVKLHCAGAVPVLLWLFRQYQATEGAAAASQLFSGVGASSAASAASATAAGVAGAEAAKTGAAVAGKFTLKKLIAGIVAAAVAAGGAAIALLPEDKPEPITHYSGYGDVDGSASLFGHRRFDLNIDHRDDNTISGSLEVTNLYETVHVSEFEGTINQEEEGIVYDIVFETPLVTGTISQTTHAETQLKYDQATESYLFDDYYEVTMQPYVDPMQSPLLEKDQQWFGMGDDSFHPSLQKQQDAFTLDVYELREAGISGQLTVARGDTVYHRTEFTGRGFSLESKIHYEVLLETPRANPFPLGTALDRLWLVYDTETQTISFAILFSYQATMEKVLP